MKEFFLSPVINRQGQSPFSMEEKGRKAENKGKLTYSKVNRNLRYKQGTYIHKDKIV